MRVISTCSILVLVVLVSTALADSTSKPVTFAALSREAQQATDENRLDDAVRLYRRALAIRPSWADGWWSVDTIEYDQNHYSKAAGAFAHLIRLQPKNGTAHAMLGLCQFEQGADASALKSLRVADNLGILNNGELRDVTLYHLGVLELRTGRFGDAYETLHDLAEKGLQTKELLIALAQSALLINPRESARTDESILQRIGQAESFSAQKKFAEAEQIYTDLIARFPDLPNLHFAFGRMLLDARKEDDAVREFRQELTRDRTNVNSMLEIASVEYRQDSQDGLKYAEQAVKLAPAIPFGHYMLGMLRLDTGDAAGAIPELEIVRKAFPDRSQIYFALGNAYARVGRKEDAAQARAEFTRLDAQAKASQNSDRPNATAERRLWLERKPSN